MGAYMSLLASIVLGTAAHLLTRQRRPPKILRVTERPDPTRPLGSNGPPHIPTERDVQHVCDTLLDWVPLELARLILDAAEYWPVLTCQQTSAPVRAVSAMHYPQCDARYCYFITPRIPGRVGARVRKVVFRVSSRDQGWGGDPGLTEPYAGSWTWFEAAIVRGLGGEDFINDADEAARSIEGSLVPRSPAEDGTTSQLPEHVLETTSSTTGTEDVEEPASTSTGSPPTRPYQVVNPITKERVWMLQRNLRATKGRMVHEIVWTEEDREEDRIDSNEVLDKTGRGGGYGFVRHLQGGDRIAVYARARFPGWINQVSGVEVQMYYSL